MAKNKIRQTTPENDYFYEVVGVTLIILGIITLGELGRFGSFMLLLLRLFIGDYAFLLVLFLMFLGFRSLVKKEFIDFATLNFQGLVLLVLSLCLVSHLAIFNALDIYPSQVLTKTLSLYRYYLSNFESHYVTGGGMVGALLFQGIILLVGEVGILLVALAFFLLGTSFVLNTHLIGLFTNGSRFKPILKKVFFSTFTYFKNLHYKEKPKISKKNFNLNIGLLKDTATDSNYTLQKQINEEVQLTLKDYIINNQMFCIYLGYEISYAYTRYIVQLVNERSYKNLREKMNGFFDNKCFFIRSDDNIVYVDVYNIFKDLLSLKRLLLKCEEKKILLGLDMSGDLIDLNTLNTTCLVMLGDYNSGIRNSVKSLLLNALIIHQRNVSFLVIDTKKEFLELSNTSELISYSLNNQDTNYYFNKLVSEYEKRKEILNYLDCDNFEEANESIRTTHPNIDSIQPMYVIINTDFRVSNVEFENKLDYLVKFSYKTGIFFTIVIRKKEELSKLKISYNAFMAFHTSDLDLSLKLCGNENLCALNKKGDFLYIKKNEALHAQAPFVSNSDYMNILRRII